MPIEPASRHATSSFLWRNVISHVEHLGDRVTLVLHDWGSRLGSDWAMRHADRAAGIATGARIPTLMRG